MKVVQIEENDNIAVATENIKEGTTIEWKGEQIVILNDVPVGHKVAVKRISKGEGIIKYNVPIGKAKNEILIGEYVHVHNVEDVTASICQEHKEAYLNRSDT